MSYPIVAPATYEQHPACPRSASAADPGVAGGGAYQLADSKEQAAGPPMQKQVMTNDRMRSVALLISHSEDMIAFSFGTGDCYNMQHETKIMKHFGDD